VIAIIAIIVMIAIIATIVTIALVMDMSVTAIIVMIVTVTIMADIMSKFLRLLCKHGRTILSLTNGRSRPNQSANICPIGSMF
jgi:hypothetical protein